MNTLESLFPSPPGYAGFWQTLYLEPIAGSGERISVAVAAVGENNEVSIIQAIRSDLIECLYGVQSSNMQNMITWIIDSATNELVKNNSLEEWIPPFDGIIVGEKNNATDDNIDGILRQAIRFSASLSSLSLDADRDEDDQQPKRYSERWTTSISDELKAINPSLISFFKKKVRVNDSKIQTTYGFLNQEYVANFGLLVPERLSSSLTTVKAKILDLETFKKSHTTVKPNKYEIIIGTPSYNDPTLPDKSVKKIKENIELISEIASQEGIEIFQAFSADSAAKHLNDVAA